MTTDGDKPESFQPVAALLAVALPGAGQLSLGYRARGLCIMAGVLGLFLGGLFIGGLTCVDSRENRIWFIGQALTGPVAFFTDALHQTFYKGLSPSGPNAGKLVTPGPDETIVIGPGGKRMIAAATPGQPPVIVKSLGRPSELGVLFGAIAGMLNLICIIDAAWSQRARATGLPPALDRPSDGALSGGTPVSPGAPRATGLPPASGRPSGETLAGGTPVSAGAGS